MVPLACSSIRLTLLRERILKWADVLGIQSMAEPDPAWIASILTSS